MKKLALILALCLLVCSFAACAPKEEPVVDEPITEDPVAGDDAIISGMPNPMVETDADGFAAKFGNCFKAPEEAEDIKYFIVNDELVEAQFTFNTLKVVYRVKPADAFEDISGIFTENWLTNATDCDVIGRAGKIDEYVSDGMTTQACLWYDVVPGMMYSVSATGADVDGFDIEGLAESCFVCVQGEA